VSTWTAGGARAALLSLAVVVIGLAVLGGVLAFAWLLAGR
jgi:hypothetical protein